MVSKCPNCGANIDSDDKFCKFCGTKLPDDTTRVEISGKINHIVNIRKERINQTRIAKAEIKAKAESERLKNLAELQREQRETNKENFKQSMILIGVVLALLLIFMLFRR